MPQMEKKKAASRKPAAPSGKKASKPAVAAPGTAAPAKGAPASDNLLRQVAVVSVRRKAFLEQRDVLNPLGRERPDLGVLRYVGQQIQATLGVREAIGMHEIRLRALAGQTLESVPGQSRSW